MRRRVSKRIGRRLRELNLPDLEAYRARLSADPGEWAVLDELCRVTISRFWRDRAVFEELRRARLPRLAALASSQGRPVRLWSAGCASGEEPYSLALLLRLGMEPSPSFEILATDADPTVLARAREGRYSLATVRELPEGWVKRAFAPEHGEGLRLLPAFREGVHFERQDLRTQMPEGPFDAVLCRNLAFTYFDQPSQQRVLQLIGERLIPEGVLVLGAHEALPAGSGWVRQTPLPIYERAGG